MGGWVGWGGVGQGGGWEGVGWGRVGWRVGRGWEGWVGCVCVWEGGQDEGSQATKRRKLAGGW